MRTTRLLLIAALLSPAGGCSWLDNMRGHGEAAKKGGPLSPLAPDKLVDYLNERAGLLRSIQYDSLRLRVYEKGVPMPSLDGYLACAQPRSFRLKAGKAGGDVDLGSNPDHFWVYVKVPAEKPMYVFASHTDFESGKAKLPGGIPFEPDWVMQALGMNTFPPNTAYKVAVNEKERTYTLSWAATTPAGVPIRKEIIFDGDTARDPRPQVKKHVIRDAKDKVLAYAEIKAAKTAQLGSDPRNPAGPQAAQYPTQVILKWEEQKFEMDLTLDGAQVNQAMTPEAQQRLFTKPNIPNVPQIDLAKYEFR